MSADFYVHIVESPSPAELRDGVTEGRALCSFLDIAGIPYSYSLAVDLDQFRIAMTNKVDEAINGFSKLPILHLSVHGGEGGIQLTNQEKLLWSELADYIHPINNRLNGRLDVCMSCCGGAYGAQMAQVFPDSPYNWLVGSFADVALPDIALAYSILYRRVHCGYENLLELIETVRAASGISDFGIWDGKRIQEEYR